MGFLAWKGCVDHHLMLIDHNHLFFFVHIDFYLDPCRLACFHHVFPIPFPLSPPLPLFWLYLVQAHLRFSLLSLLALVDCLANRSARLLYTAFRRDKSQPDRIYKLSCAHVSCYIAGPKDRILSRSEGREVLWTRDRYADRDIHLR